MTDNLDNNSLKIGVLPKKITIQPLKRISPSEFSSLQKCPMKVIYRKSRIKELLPKSPSARLGSVIHRILELYGKRTIQSIDEFESTWNREIAFQEAIVSESWLERHLLPLSRNIRYFTVKKKQCFKLVEKILLFNQAGNDVKHSEGTITERWLESTDKLIVGKTDAIIPTINGDIIVDYKSGKITSWDNKNQRCSVYDNYKTQIWLYAALYYETYERWPVELHLVAINGEFVIVDFESGQCLELLEKAKNHLLLVNRTINDTDLALDEKIRNLSSPSPDTCKFCLYRPICEQYWERRRSGSGWPLDISGTLKEMKTTRKGNVIVRVLDERNRIITIRDLSSSRHPNLLDESAKMWFLNLRSSRFENYYSEGRFTTIYVSLQ